MTIWNISAVKVQFVQTLFQIFMNHNNNNAQLINWDTFKYRRPQETWRDLYFVIITLQHLRMLTCQPLKSKPNIVLNNFVCNNRVKVAITSYLLWFEILLISNDRLNRVFVQFPTYLILDECKISCNQKSKESWFIHEVKVFWKGHKSLKKSSSLFWHLLSNVKNKRKISSNFVAFSEYMKEKSREVSTEPERIEY